MKPSQVLNTLAPQHLCIFGDPKTGKSTLAAKLLLLAGVRLTWISMDNGHTVLFKLGLSPEELDEKVNLIILPDTKENPVAIRTCLKIMSGVKTLICDKHGEVNCPVCQKQKDAATWSEVDTSQFGPKDVIVFDHLGQLATSAMTVAFKKARKDDEEKPEWDQYAMQGILLDKFLTNVQQAKFHVICITHVGEVEMEDGAKKLVPLCGTTNFSRNTSKYFDHIIYCHMKNASHRFGSSTTYQNNLVLGSRLDVVIDNTNPSLLPFIDGTIPSLKKEEVREAKPILSSLAQKVQVIEHVPEQKQSAPEQPHSIEETKGDSNEVAGSKQEPEPQTRVPTQPQTQPPAKATPSSKDRAALLASLTAGRR